MANPRANYSKEAFEERHLIQLGYVKPEEAKYYRKISPRTQRFLIGIERNKKESQGEPVKAQVHFQSGEKSRARSDRCC